MLSIPITLCDEGDRARKDYGDLTSLRDALRTYGTLHPPVFSLQPDGRYLLIYGGRRFRSLVQNGVTELFHNSILDPLRPGFMFAEDIPQDRRKELELHENLHRLQPKWTEDVCLIAEIHAYKQKTEGHSQWGVKETEMLLGGGPSNNTRKIQYCIRIAKLINAGDKEIIACRDISDAIGLLTERKANEGLKILTERMATTAKSVAPDFSFMDTFTDGIETLKGGDANDPGAISMPSDPHACALPVPQSNPSGPEIPLSVLFTLGNSIWDPGEWPRVDHIITDIPYGINMDNLENVESVKEQHQVDSNIEDMPIFLRRSFSAVKDGGFCVFFYDLDHHEKLQLFATASGWAVQRWPLIITKSSPCRNQAAQYNTTKNYESVMVLRKPGAVIRKPVMSSTLEKVDFRGSTTQYAHPFAKPFLVWQWIYTMFTIPGQSVLDPYCGEMSACSAAATCGLLPYGIESEEVHFNRGLQHMRETYQKIHGPAVKFI